MSRTKVLKMTLKTVLSNEDIIAKLKSKLLSTDDLQTLDVEEKILTFLG